MTSPPDRAYWDTPADPAAVQAYLDLADSPLEIARLSAALLPPLEQYDLPRAADLAVSLRLEAAAALVRQREKMLAGMTYRTLLDLAEALDVDATAAALTCAGDPLRGPLQRHLLAVNAADTQVTREHNAAVTAALLARSGQQTALPRPGDDCTLEEALRYAAPEPTLPWPQLRLVFHDFLGIYRHRNDPPPAGPEEKAYLESFAPGLEMPSSFASAAIAKLTLHWQEDHAVSPERLAWLCDEFHAFWTRHRPAYLALFKTRAAVSRKRAAASEKATASREHNRWLATTRQLIAHLRQHGLPATVAERREMLARFAAAERKDPAAIKRVTAFYGTLLNALHSPATGTGEIRRLLAARPRAQEGSRHSTRFIQAIDAATVEACRTLLEEAFPQS